MSELFVPKFVGEVQEYKICKSITTSRLLSEMFMFMRHFKIKMLFYFSLGLVLTNFMYNFIYFAEFYRIVAVMGFGMNKLLVEVRKLPALIRWITEADYIEHSSSKMLSNSSCSPVYYAGLLRDFNGKKSHTICPAATFR